MDPVVVEEREHHLGEVGPRVRVEQLGALCELDGDGARLALDRAPESLVEPVL